MARFLERLLNAVVRGVFLALGATLRGFTAAAALLLRRGRHRAWRRDAERDAQRRESSPDA
jgi:hypothetical protein